jgi:AraC-like DNA-binding protein
MTIRRFFPSAFLAPYVKEYVIIETDLEILNKTIPDTAMVMSFRYRGSVVKVDGVNQEKLTPTAVSGIRKTARCFQYAKGTGNLLVILKEGAFPSFSKVPAHELFASSYSTENVFHIGELTETLERLNEALDDNTRIDLVEAFLKKKVVPHRDDALVAHAVGQIKDRNGIVRIKDLASELCISQDPFEKRFRAKVGCSPKQYATIVRLRNLITNFSPAAPLTSSSYAAGYFDQSHFIKDFKQFTGQSPKEFFKSAGFW